MKRPCTAPDCSSDVYAKGLCDSHYKRIRKYGTLEQETPEQRFWSKVDKSQDCWLWTSALKDNGYGTVTMNGKRLYSHRSSFEMAHGPIPEGMMVDHICHTRACVNPDHLRLANNKQNLENMSGPKVTSKSGVRGVYMHESGKWRAQVTHNRRRYNGGSFTHIEDAEAAAIALRNKLFTHNTVDRAA